VGAPNGGGGLPGKLSAWIAAGTALVALGTGLIGLDQGWFDRTKSRKCSMAGVVAMSLTGAPAPAVRLGYRPEDGASDFIRLTRSGADGSFSSSCEGAKSATSGGSFELLAEGTFRGGVLPCLGPPERTGVFVDREGESKGLSVEIQGC
jgi:hypothetical protein